MDPTYWARMKVAKQRDRIDALERALKKAKCPRTIEILCNALCACHAKVAAVTLAEL